MARPSIYTPELAAKICERLAAGESLLSICRDESMPARTTVCTWVVEDREGFAALHDRARNLGLDVMAEKTLEIAATPRLGKKTTAKASGIEVTTGDMVDRARLDVDTRKWYLAKLAPKRYGERSAVEVSGPAGGPLVFDDATRAAKIEAIFDAAARRRDSGEDLV